MTEPLPRKCIDKGFVAALTDMFYLQYPVWESVKQSGFPLIHLLKANKHKKKKGLLSQQLTIIVIFAKIKPMSDK